MSGSDACGGELESEVDNISITEVSHPKYERYREFLDDDGNKIYKDRKTGKEYKSITEEVECPEGSKIVIYHPAQLEAMDRKNRQEIERVRNNGLSFYFCLSEDRRGMLEPQTIARLFYLATFIHPNDNVLRYDDGTAIKRGELSRLMLLSTGALHEFLKEVSERYLFRQSDGTMTISHDFFRGKMDKHMQHDADNGYQKVFIKSLRELYKQTPTRKHRYLGYLFLLLPFINWEYNVLCWNADEKDAKKINPMSLSDFCNAIGYDDNGGCNSQKLVNAYNQLTFTFRGEEMDVCSYLNNVTTGKKYFVINPDVIYRGHDRRKVEGFGVFFPHKPKRKN